MGIYLFGRKIMRKTILLLFSVVCCVFISFCTDTESDGARMVTIQPTITRVAGLAFETGDKIGLTIQVGATNHVTNTELTYNGTVFTSGTLLWYNNAQESSTLTAYYPYAVAGSPTEFTVLADQSSRLNNMTSDLLISLKRNVLPTANAVPMIFKHALSKLKITVTNNATATITKLSIGGAIPTATVDLQIPSVVVKNGVATADIACFNAALNEYHAIVVPQTATLMLLVQMSDGKLHTHKLLPATIESGKAYGIAVTLTDIDISATLSGEIADWIDGGVLPPDGGGGGDAGVNTLVYQGVTYTTAQLGDRVWMTENLRYLPAGSQLNNGIWSPSGGAEKGGLLYDFAHGQTLCPSGWHLPEQSEFEALLTVLKPPYETLLPLVGIWNASGVGALTEGKTILMGSSPATDEKHFYLINTGTDKPAVMAYLPSNGVSVRCVKNK